MEEADGDKLNFAVRPVSSSSVSHDIDCGRTGVRKHLADGRRRRRPPSSFREIPININNSDADRREERPRGVVNCELIKQVAVAALSSELQAERKHEGFC